MPIGRAAGLFRRRDGAGRVRGASGHALLRPWERAALWVGGTAFVAAAAYASFRVDYLNSQEQFLNRTETARQELVRHLDDGRSLMAALSALYEASESMTGTELAAVTRKLLRGYPYFRVVGYASMVDSRERRGFEREIRTEGNSGYRIRDIGVGGAAGRVAPRRQSYLPISFLSTRGREARRRMGIDILTDPVLASAARSAIVNGDLSVAPIDPLAPDRAHLVGFRATYEGKHNHRPGSGNRHASGVFMMVVDAGAILRRVRRDNPRLLIDLVPENQEVRRAWRRLGLTIPGTPRGGLHRLTPPQLVGWTHALGDLAFGIRVRSTGSAADLNGWVPALAVLLATLIVLGFVFWLRHRRHDREHHLALQDREGKLSAVLNTVADGIVTIDEHGIIQTFNSAAEKLFGYGEQEVLGKNVTMLMPQSEAAVHDSHLAPHRGRTRKLTTSPSRELCGRRADGSEFPIELSLSRAALGRGSLFTGVIRDISDRKRFETAIKRSEERFRDFANSASDWFWETDAELNYTFLSDEYFERFDVARGMVIGQRFGSFCQTKGDPDFQAGMAALDSRQPFRDFNFTVALPNGVSAEISFSGKPAYDANGNFEGYRGTASDMTDRRRLEEQLTQSRRLEAIGKLTGGVAHEFNNLLSVIGGFARMARRNPDNAERQAEAIDTIIQAAEQGAQLTRQLLAFSRKQELAPRLVAVSDIVEGVKVLLPRLVGEKVTLRFESYLPARVRIDPGQLSQAILNLASNSCDAMLDGGSLTIRAARETFETPRRFGQQVAEPGRYVALTVADTGCGIPLEDQSQIFEPFFTTKDEDKGTGLGLSMVYGLVAQSGGYVGVDSAPGQGCAITLYLPEMAEAPEVLVAEDGTVQRLALVVEAHEGTREVTAMTLENEGFTVINAATAAEALAAYGGDPVPLQLLVCGAAPTDSEGLGLTRALRANIPALRVIYLIHREADVIADMAAGETEFTRALQKPIDPDLLVDLVGEIL